MNTKMSGNLVVKRKLPPRSGSSLETVNPSIKRGHIVFFKRHKNNEIFQIGMDLISQQYSSFGGVSGLTNIGSTTCFLLSRKKLEFLLVIPIT